MREHKFRGKRTDNGEWVYGYYIKAKGHWHNKGIHEDWIICNAMQNGGWFALGAKYPVITETVGQFTGLPDKNGKEIFEGDIVRYQFDNDDCPFPNKHTEKIIGRIFFSDWRASFSVTAGRNGSDMMNNDLFNYIRGGNRVEVIGNIHDNPELLKGAQ